MYTPDAALGLKTGYFTFDPIIAMTKYHVALLLFKPPSASAIPYPSPILCHLPFLFFDPFSFLLTSLNHAVHWTNLPLPTHRVGEALAYRRVR